MRTDDIFEYLRENAEYVFRGTSTAFFRHTRKVTEIELEKKGFYVSSWYQSVPDATFVTFSLMQAVFYALHNNRKAEREYKRTKPLLLIIKLEDYRKNIRQGLEFGLETGGFEGEITVPIKLEDITLAGKKEIKDIRNYLPRWVDGVPVGFSEREAEMDIDSIIEKNIKISLELLRLKK